MDKTYNIGRGLTRPVFMGHEYGHGSYDHMIINKQIPLDDRGRDLMAYISAICSDIATMPACDHILDDIYRTVLDDYFNSYDSGTVHSMLHSHGGEAKVLANVNSVVYYYIMNHSKSVNVVAFSEECATAIGEITDKLSKLLKMMSVDISVCINKYSSSRLRDRIKVHVDTKTLTHYNVSIL